MADMIDTLKGLLGDDADKKINSVMSALGSTNAPAEEAAAPEPSTTSAPAITPELLVQAQGLIRQLSSPDGDNRAYLLQSLKPYVRDNRKNSIDTAIKLLNITRLSKLFKGGLPF